ncbi:MAG TPA: acyltransferase [Solirubrobacteraceae bacterium]|nr:acyltransferase [Solirubrobacteraceae bacterium]
MSSGRTKLDGFDGLRALAALTVLTYHVALSRGFSPAGSLAPLLWELKGGVAIFFVISGALLYLPYARAIRDGADLPGWRAYARRRGVRILPAYWIALTAVALGPFNAGIFGPDAGTYYGLSQIYNPQTLFGGLQVAWSLCVEVTFYAFLPVFAWLVARGAGRRSGGDRGQRVQLMWIAGAGLASLLLRAALAASPTGAVHGSGATLMTSLPGLLDWFALGMALAVLRAELEAGRASRSVATVLGRRSWLCVALGFAAFMAGVPAQHADVFLPWYGFATHVAVGLGSGLLVLAVITAGDGGPIKWPLRVLRSPVAAWVGTISYGIYLWHFPVLELLDQVWIPTPSSTVLTDALVLVGVTAGALGLGAASFYLVERPARRLLRRLESRTRLPGRPGQNDETVQPGLDSLNSTGVAVDHLA